MRDGRKPTYGVQQGEGQLGAVEGVGARGSRGRGHRRGGKHRPQLALTGRVHSGRRQGVVEPDGVVAVGDHGVADAEALLPVGLEHVGEAEALAAHLAGVRLLPGVGAAVALHVGPAGEALPTDLTDVRLLSCRMWESTFSIKTILSIRHEDRKWLTSVCLHVLIKVLLHVEVLSAPLAHELLVSDVDAHVGAQLVLVLEAFATVLEHSEEFAKVYSKKMKFARI